MKTRKRVLALLLSLLLLFSLLSAYAAAEEEGPYPAYGADYSDVVPLGTPTVQMTGAYCINPADTAGIKAAIRSHGGVFASIFFDYNCYSFTYNSMCTNANYCNHGIMLVGWDDSFSRSNFSSRCMPDSDGAWLVRNSWGEDEYGYAGYFWLSYCDTALLGSGAIIAFDAEERAYTYCYSYTTTPYPADIDLLTPGELLCQDYTIADGELLKEFQSDARIMLYTDPASSVAPVEVTGVNLNKTELELKCWESELLTATVLPAEAGNQELSWLSGKPEVATVDNGGSRFGGADGGEISLTRARGGTGRRAFALLAATVSAAVEDASATVLAQGAEAYLCILSRGDTVRVLEKGLERCSLLFDGGATAAVPTALLVFEEAAYAPWTGYARYKAPFHTHWRTLAYAPRLLSMNTELQIVGVFGEDEAFYLVELDGEIGLVPADMVSESKLAVSSYGGVDGGGGGGGGGGAEWSDPVL